MWQAVVCLVAMASWAAADEPAKTFTWSPPKIAASMFSNDLGMLGSERDDYATNIAIYASNRVATAKASPASLDEARRLLAVALHLSTRNRKALVSTFQLGKGVLPEVVQSDYSPQVLARLLLTRGQLLQKQGGEENALLARIFVELAAGMDPKNEDAVYASEVQRLDHGAVNWTGIIDFAGRDKAAPANQTP